MKCKKHGVEMKSLFTSSYCEVCENTTDIEKDPRLYWICMNCHSVISDENGPMDSSHRCKK